MAYPRTGFKSYVRGFDVISATSLTTSGAVSAGTTVTAGTGITATTGTITASADRVVGAGITSTIDGSAGTPSVKLGASGVHGSYVVSSQLGLVANNGLRMMITATNITTESGVELIAQNQFEVDGGLALASPPATKTSHYTMVTATDFYAGFDSTSGAITVTLPAAASNNRTVYVIRKTVAHANAVTIDPNGAELIDGGATLAVADNTAKWIMCNGTGWVTIMTTN